MQTYLRILICTICSSKLGDCASYVYFEIIVVDLCVYGGRDNMLEE